MIKISLFLRRSVAVSGLAGHLMVNFPKVKCGMCRPNEAFLKIYVLLPNVATVDPVSECVCMVLTTSGRNLLRPQDSNK